MPGNTDIAISVSTEGASSVVKRTPFKRAEKRPLYAKIPAHLWEGLHMLALSRRRTMKDELEEAIAKHLADRKRKR